MKMSRKTLWGYIFLPLTLILIGMECWAGFDSDPNTVPWTSYIIHDVPWPMTVLAIIFFMAWVPWHFWKAHKEYKAEQR